jgi:glutamine synthetase
LKKTVKDIMDMIKDHDIKMVDFKMVDINGQFRHVTIPAKNFNEDTMKSGIGFDASNYGYAVVEKSDMVFVPDPDTACIDPFCETPTLSMTGNAMIIDKENRPLAQYPRNIVIAAEKYMQDSGIADEMLILPEFEVLSNFCPNGSNPLVLSSSIFPRRTFSCSDKRNSSAIFLASYFIFIILYAL